MAEHQLPKLTVRVRFPSPALTCSADQRVYGARPPPDSGAHPTYPQVGSAGLPDGGARPPGTPKWEGARREGGWRVWRGARLPAGPHGWGVPPGARRLRVHEGRAPPAVPVHRRGRSGAPVPGDPVAPYCTACAGEVSSAGPQGRDSAVTRNPVDELGEVAALRVRPARRTGR